MSFLDANIISRVTSVVPTQAICYMVAVWLHYSCLASCSWLLSYAVFLGHQLRQGDDDMFFYNSIGGVVPAVIVIISVLWRHQDYRDPD